MEWLLLGVLALGWAGFAMWKKSRRPGAIGTAPKVAASAGGGPLRVVESSSYPRTVVGESHYQDALKSICGGYSRDGHDHRTQAVLSPEPNNPHDPDAVVVTIDGMTVGYLAREDAVRFHAGLAKAGHAGASVKCGAKIVGGWKTNQHDAGRFGVYLAIKWPMKLA